MEHIKMVHVFENIALMKRFGFSRGKVTGKFTTLPHDPVHDLCKLHSIVRIRHTQIQVQTTLCKVNHLEGERCKILIWISEETDCDMSHNVLISDLLLPQQQSV